MRMVCVGCSFSLSHQTVIQTSIKVQTPSLTSPLQVFHVGSSASGTRLPFISPRRCWEGPLVLEILKQSHPPAFLTVPWLYYTGAGDWYIFPWEDFFRKFAKSRLHRLHPDTYRTLPLPETFLILREMKNKSRKVSGSRQSSNITLRIINIPSETTSKCDVNIAPDCRDPVRFSISFSENARRSSSIPILFLNIGLHVSKIFFFNLEAKSCCCGAGTPLLCRSSGDSRGWGMCCFNRALWKQIPTHGAYLALLTWFPRNTMVSCLLCDQSWQKDAPTGSICNTTQRNRTRKEQPSKCMQEIKPQGKGSKGRRWLG